MQMSLVLGHSDPSEVFSPEGALHYFSTVYQEMSQFP
jgi:hypothetical protein